MGAERTDVRLIIKGTPVPKGRLRFTRSGHTYTPKATRDHEELIRAEFLASGGGLLDGFIDAEFEFVYEPPKSWSKRERLRVMGQPKITKPDLDNLIKCCEDALTGVAYTDDNRIWKTTASKVYGAEDMTIIRLREAETD